MINDDEHVHNVDKIMDPVMPSSPPSSDESINWPLKDITDLSGYVCDHYCHMKVDLSKS